MINAVTTSGMADPLFPWFNEIVIPLIWLGMAAFHVYRTRRTGTLSMAALLFLGGTTLWWQETYADWAAYILFNPKFALMPWGNTPWTSPNKPWNIIPGYGFFFGVGFTVLIILVMRLQKARPSWSSLRTTSVVVAPLFYLWDLGVEGTSVALGWYSYTQVIGPALMMERGNFPLMWPSWYFVFFAVMTVWLLVQRDTNGVWLHERLLGVHRLASGCQRELARFLAWAVTMNAMFWFVYNLPTCLLRAAFGGPSALVP